MHVYAMCAPNRATHTTHNQQTLPMNTGTDQFVLEVRFDNAWTILHMKKLCADLGTQEYRRVRGAWISDGRPATVAKYIVSKLGQLSSEEGLCDAEAEDEQ